MFKFILTPVVLYAALMLPGCSKPTEAQIIEQRTSGVALISTCASTLQPTVEIPKSFKIIHSETSNFPMSTGELGVRLVYYYGNTYGQTLIAKANCLFDNTGNFLGYQIVE